MAQQPVLFYDFKDGLAQNSDGSCAAKVSNCEFQVYTPSFSKPSWGPLKYALRLKGPKSYVELPEIASLQNVNAFTLEMVISPNLTGSGEFPLFAGKSLPLKFSLKRSGKSQYLLASVYLNNSWQSIETPALMLDKERVYVAAMYTQDALVIFVEGFPKARRVFVEQQLAPAGAAQGFFGSDGVSSKSQFTGLFHGVRAWDIVAPHLTAGLKMAESQGLGEIESKYLELGGDVGMLHKPILPEQAHGKGRCREYQGGAIYWSEETGAHAVMGRLSDYYLKRDDVHALLGFPTADMFKLPFKDAGAYVSRFENGALYFSEATGIHELYGDLYGDYLTKGGETLTGSLGLPTTAPIAQGPGIQKCHFQKGSLYRHPEFGSVALHGVVRDYYCELKEEKSELQYPVSSDMPQKDDQGKIKGAVALFQGGRIYSHVQYGAVAMPSAVATEYLQWGATSGILGFPTRTAVWHGHYAYYTFERGMIRYDGKSCRTLKGVRLRLGWVRSEQINDGAFNKDAELITYTSVKINGKWIEKDKRRDGKNSAFELGVSYPGEKQYIQPLSLDTVIELKVKVCDYDKWSANDYLGTFEKTFTIDHIFDLAPTVGMGTLILAKKGTGEGVLSKNEIKLEYALQKAPLSETLPPNLHFRQYHWWYFDNFKTSGMTWKQCAEIFADMSPDRPVFKLLHVIFYNALYKECGAKGNCVGMSLEALRCLYGESDFATPLYDYGQKKKWEVEWEDVNREYSRRIERFQGYQYGMAFVMDYLNKLAFSSTLLKPVAVYKRAKKLIDAGTLPMISIVDSARGYRSHTVVAYDYTDGKNGNPHKLWTADPNDPWEKMTGDSTHLEIHNDGYFRTVNSTYKVSKTDLLPGTFMPNEFFYETPYALMRGQQYSAVFGIQLWVIQQCFVLSGDACSQQIEIEGEKLWALQGKRKVWAGSKKCGVIPFTTSGADGEGPEIYFSRQRPGKSLKVSLQGRQEGQTRLGWMTPRGSLSLQLPTTARENDEIEILHQKIGRPEMRLTPGKSDKRVTFEWEDGGDEQWAYRVELPASRARTLVIRRAEYGPGIEIEPGAGNVKMTITVEDRSANSTAQKVTCTALEAGEQVVVAPVRDRLGINRITVEYRSAVSGRLRQRIVKKTKR